MPDYRIRVREINEFWTTVKADSFEDALDTVDGAIGRADSVIDDLPLHEGSAGWETDGGAELTGWPQNEVDMHQHELITAPELDTASSASRQNWIETGLYLTHDEVKEFAT